MRHNLSECRECLKEQRVKIYKDLRRSEPGRHKTKRADISNDSNETPNASYLASLLFGATLSSKVNQTVCADNGADVISIDPTRLEKVIKEEINFKFENLIKTVIY